MKTLHIGVDGMTCQNCVRHVTEALQELKGVASVEVNLEQKAATLEADESVSEQLLTGALDEAGYTLRNLNAG